MSEIDKKKTSAPESKSGSDQPIETYRDDLYEERKETLGNYLKSQTSGEQYEVPESGKQILRKEHKNKFGISGDPSEFSIIDDEGRPAGIQNSPESQDSFSNQDNLEQSFNEAYRFFENLSRGRVDDSLGGGSFSNQDLSDLEIDKNTQESGHSLLNKPDSIADKVVSSVLQRNRWTPYQNPNSPENPRRYSDMNQSNVDLTNPRTEIQDFEADTQKLRNIGRSLLLAASSEDSVNSPVDVREQNFDVGSFDLGAFIQNSIPGNLAGEPDPSSLSIDFANTKIPVDRFRPLNHDITLESGSSDAQERNYTATSYGVLNNHIRQFQDQSGRSDMVQLSFLSLAAMITSSIFTLLVVEAVSSAATALTGLSYNEKTGKGLGARVLPAGNSVQKHSKALGGWGGLGDELLKILQNLPQAFVEYLGIYQPMHIGGANGYLSYSAAVGMGIISIVYAMAKDFGFSAGFFASTFRTVMRSEFLGEELLQNPTGLSTNGFDSLIGYFRNLRESRALKALNYLAKLGDIFYVSYARDEAYAIKNVSNLGKFVVEGQKKYKINSKNGRNYRSHPSKIDGKLNWRVSSAIDSIIKPAYENRAYQYIRSDLIGVGIVQGYLEGFGTTNSQNEEELIGEIVDKPKRLSKEFVQAMEETLESEYMPFYFQDLRTNEIISFHAFLSTLTDGFQANYNSSKGFGRMDPVMTYGDTTRSIGFSFTVFATSKEDFDVMWKKINKMVTLVYPQWSGGTKVRSADDQHLYTIPFSQVPTASPLIRVRIGDLIKSNYSRKDMTRLFGSSDNDFTAHGVAFGSLYHSVWERKRRKEASKQFNIWASSLVDDNGNFKVMAPPHKPHQTPVKYRIASGEQFWILNLSNDATQKAFTELNNPDKKLSKIETAGRRRTIIDKTFIERTYREDGVVRGYDWEIMDYARIIKENNGTSNTIRERLDERLVDIITMFPGLDKYFGYPSEETWIANTFFCQPAAETKEILLQGYEQKQNNILASLTDDPNQEEDDARALYDACTGWIKAIKDNNCAFFITKEQALSQAAWQQDAFISEEWSNQNPEPTDIPSVVEKVEASQKFFDPEKNPILKAFESTAGKGMPGVVTQLGLDWKLNEYGWEIDPGSKAPMGCEISITFQPIHEIAPGLDKNGINRAPVFRVGSSADKE